MSFSPFWVSPSVLSCSYPIYLFYIRSSIIMLSLAGVITFKNYGHHEDIKRIPLDRILVETDAPYVAPAPYRGKRNEPSYIKFVAEKLAEIKGVSFEEVEKQTSANAKKLFSI